MNKKILLIDDEELIVRSLVKLFEKNGFKVFVAKSGDEAIGMAKDMKFDLIISDVRMPGINGVEAVRGIYQGLKERSAPQPPVIFITGYAHEECEKEAEALNPVGYIYKPFDVTDLMNRVQKIMT